MTAPEGPRRDRAAGALYGLAIGDALGMPTQMMSRQEVVARYGIRLTWFEPADAAHPVAAGLPAGSVTDDTEQAVLLATMLVDGKGEVDAADWARALGRWEAAMVGRGSADLLGPSTRAALRAVERGVPPELAGATGATNGAAMRIAPVGVAVPVGALGGVDALVDAVVAISRVTHGTDVALAGAVAVAAAVSAGVDGADVPAACALAIQAAPRGAARGNPSRAESLTALIDRARTAVDGTPPERAAEVIESSVGTSLDTVESVPAAFAVLSLHPDNPWEACLLGASLGGDSDTIAAIIGAIAGACHGASAFPAPARDLVTRVNCLRLETHADGLLALRRRQAERHRDAGP